MVHVVHIHAPDLRETARTTADSAADVAELVPMMQHGSFDEKPLWWNDLQASSRDFITAESTLSAKCLSGGSR